MGVMDRFFGGRDKSEQLGEQLVANQAALDKLLSLQVLFPEPVVLESENMKAWLRVYDPELARAECEIDPATAAQGTPLGLAGWRNHVIQIVGFYVPYPAEGLERGLSGSHVTEEMKATARAHQAHVILYYAGYEESVLEQYVALAAVAGALAGLGASMVMNEHAMTSLPAAVFTFESAKGRRMELLRALPLLWIYCGCVKHWVEGIPGAWVRTYGNYLLGTPDLAMHTTDERAGTTAEMFGDLLGYLLHCGAKFTAGETVRWGELLMRLRTATEEEYFLENPGPLFVAEIVSD
jgi:hypothetical protein